MPCRAPASVTERSGTLPDWAGQPLFLRQWVGGDPPLGVVVMVHGIGGHSGLFDGVARHLAPHGWHCFGLDLPGHGHSAGARGWIPRWAALRDPVEALLRHSARRHPSAPCFLLGHSLGATVVLDLALRQPALSRGLILSNPALDAEGVAPWRRLLARMLSRLWPRFTLDTGIPLEASCRDPDVLAAYAGDSLRHSRCSVRLGTEFMAIAARLRADGHRLRVPLLVLQSGNDTITPAGSTRRFFDRLTSPDRTLKLYPESLHELFDDLDRMTVLDDLLAWLNAHVA